MYGWTCMKLFIDAHAREPCHSRVLTFASKFRFGLPRGNLPDFIVAYDGTCSRFLPVVLVIRAGFVSREDLVFLWYSFLWRGLKLGVAKMKACPTLRAGVTTMMQRIA